MLQSNSDFFSESLNTFSMLLCHAYQSRSFPAYKAIVGQPNDVTSLTYVAESESEFSVTRFW